MSAIEDTRKVVRDFIAPDLKSIDAGITALEKMVDTKFAAAEQVATVRHESLAGMIAKFEANALNAINFEKGRGSRRDHVATGPVDDSPEVQNPQAAFGLGYSVPSGGRKPRVEVALCNGMARQSTSGVARCYAMWYGEMRHSRYGHPNTLSTIPQSTHAL